MDEIYFNLLLMAKHIQRIMIKYRTKNGYVFLSELPEFSKQGNTFSFNQP